jgi:hypothetical protein
MASAFSFQQPNRQFKFHKSSQLFISPHNETLSVVAVRVCNEDRSPVGIHCCDATPTPIGFAEVVSDDLADKNVTISSLSRLVNALGPGTRSISLSAYCGLHEMKAVTLNHLVCNDFAALRTRQT